MTHGDPQVPVPALLDFDTWLGLMLPLELNCPCVEGCEDCDGDISPLIERSYDAP